MIGYIYKVTKKLNNKIYVVKRQKSLWDEHYFGSGQHIKRAIKKYGKENFIRELLDTAETIDELNQKECYWIEKLPARNPATGYNVGKGGEYTANNMKQIICLETGQIFSNIRAASKYLGLNTTSSINKALKNLNKTACGYHWAYLYDINLKEKLKEFKDTNILLTIKNSKTNNKKKIKCIETGEIFNTIREAKKAYNNTSINDCLGGRCKTAAGYHWQYIE